MAKNKASFLQLQGTIGGLTFVQSKTYGYHSRLPRGTHKAAKLNGVLKQNSAATLKVNGAASPLLQEMKACYGSFAQSSLWQRMVGRMFKAASTAVNDLLFSLKGMELHERHPLSRLMQPPLLEIACPKKELRVDLIMQSHCFFSKTVTQDGYCYELRVVWFDGKASRCESEAVETEWIQEQDAFPQYELVFEKPAWASHYVLVLKVQAGKEEIPVESFDAMAVQVVGSGKC